jgi:putative FmdB family regulatory protein
MPTYQYRCTACGHRFERAEPMQEHGRTIPACPRCKAVQVETVLSPFFARTARKS